VVAVLVLTYEVGANVALSSGAIASLVSRHPERLRLEYTKARTFWPGRVHIEGFDLRGRDAKLEWELRIDAADVDLSLFALLRHRFQVARVVASGITFRARFRLEATTASTDRVARMPPIDGFEAVPILGVPPDTRDAKGKPWTVDIQGVDARAVREVWIDAYRLAGLFAAKGGFTLGNALLTLAPTTAEIQAVALTTGEDALATEVTGRLDAQIDTVDLGAVESVAILRYVTVHSALDGRTGGVRFIRHFIRRDSLSLSGGVGTFRSELNLIHGRVMKGTSSRVELEPATVLFGERSIAGRVRFDFTASDADDTNDNGRTALDIGLSELSFTDGKATTPAVTCAAQAIHVRAQSIDLAEPESVERGFGYSWDTARFEVLNLHSVDATLPTDSPLHFERGTATVTARGRGTLEGASAEVQVDSMVGMQIQGARVTSGVKGAVPMKMSFLAGTLDLAGTDLTLSDPALPPWWCKVKLDVAQVHFEPPSIALALTTTARDARPFVTFYAGTQGTSAVAKTALSAIPNPLIASMTANLRGTVRLAAARGSFDLDGLDAQGAMSRLQGVLTKRAEHLEGGLLIEGGAVTVGVSFADGKTGVVLIDAPRWYAATHASLAR
jgi:hypothetical protein